MRAIILVLAVASVLAAPVPSLTVNGTHFEIGVQIGTAMGDRIVAFLASYDNLHQTLQPFVKTKAGAEQFAALMAASKAKYPQYFDEIYGMAQAMGSRVNIQDLFLMNFEDEIGTLTTPSHGSDHCSDVLVHQPKAVILAHNEDNDVSVGEYAFLLTATVHGDHGGPYTFTAYTYPAYLPGCAFGFNSNGIAMSENELYPMTVDIHGLGDSFVSRDVLASTSFEDAIRRATAGPAANGQSMNILSFREKRILNVETADGGFNVKEVTPKTADANNHTGYFYHANLYEHLNISQYTDDPSSYARMARVLQIVSQDGAPNSTMAVRNILGDTANKQYPIYRDSQPPDDVSTLATGMFDAEAGVVSIFWGNPKATQPSVTFRVH